MADKEKAAGTESMASNGGSREAGRAQEGREVTWGWFTPGRILLLLILLAAVVRVLAVLTRPMIQYDEASYVRMAENLAAGAGPLELTGLSTTHFTPLLPLLITALALIFRDYILSGYIVVVTFGSLILLPVYLLGKELSGKRVGLMAAALVAVLPLFVDYTSRIYSEGVYIFFLLMGIFFAKHLLRGCRVPCSIFAGASLGLAYLANASALFYVMVLFMLAVAVALYRGIWWQMLKALILFLLFFFIFAAPYVFYLHDQLGIWTFSGKASNFAINQYSSAHGLRYGTIEWERDLMSLTPDGDHLKVEVLGADNSPVATFLGDPVQSVKVFLKQSYLFYSSEIESVIPLWLLALLGLGLFRRGWNRRRLTGYAYLLLMMSPALLILSMYALSRFFMPFVGLALIWVAVGWYELDDWGLTTVSMSLDGAWRQRFRKITPWLVGAVVILPLLAASAIDVLGQSYQLEAKQADLWLKSQVGEGKRIMGHDTDSAYYSGGIAVLLPYADYQAFTEYAYRKKVDYLIVDRSYIEEMRPQLALLFDDNASHPEWVKIHTTGEGTGNETAVFMLVPRSSQSP